MITAEGGTRKYGNFVAVYNASLTAQAGRMTGFLSPLGPASQSRCGSRSGLNRARSSTVTISRRHHADLHLHRWPGGSVQPPTSSRSNEDDAMPTCGLDNGNI